MRVRFIDATRLTQSAFTRHDDSIASPEWTTLHRGGGYSGTRPAGDGEARKCHI